MARSNSAEREAREARERLRRYTARQNVHDSQVARRRRDNLFAILGAVVVAALATVTQVVYFTAGPGAPEPVPSASASPSEPPAAEENIGNIPAPSLAEGRTWTGTLTLNDIPLEFSLDGASAPQAVSAFIGDVQSGYFVDKSCHRLTALPTGLIQCGSLDGTGAPDPDFQFGPIENAPADGIYPAGTIAMARGATAYSQGHQFFIMYSNGTLPEDAAGGYTVIGSVTSGLDAVIATIVSQGIVENTSSGTPVVATTITNVTIQ